MGSHGASPTLPTPHSSRVPTITLHASGASHAKTFPGHGTFTSSNLVDETHVPRNAPGTPQANALGARGQRADALSPDKQTHRWPPDGQAAHPGQRCDPADPAAVMSMREGAEPIRWDTDAS